MPKKKGRSGGKGKKGGGGKSLKKKIKPEKEESTSNYDIDESSSETDSEFELQCKSKKRKTRAKPKKASLREQKKLRDDESESAKQCLKYALEYVQEHLDTNVIESRLKRVCIHIFVRFMLNHPIFVSVMLNANIRL